MPSGGAKIPGSRPFTCIKKPMRFLRNLSKQYAYEIDKVLLTVDQDPLQVVRSCDWLCLQIDLN
jgi:hypothetical protein